MIDLPSPNHDARPDGVAIDMLILHYTGMRTAQDALDRLRDPAARGSCHYTVDEDGTVYRMVPEERRAWHAGVSRWAGRPGCNDFSVGIEIVNPGHEWGYRPFPEAQMAAVEALAAGIAARWNIPAARVLGHSDVAPERKQDPGELFDWPRLARRGLGLWPQPCEPLAVLPSDAVAEAQALLAAFGYACPRTGEADAATQTVLTAFQRHFRPARVDGRLDGETLARLRALVGMLG